MNELEEKKLDVQDQFLDPSSTWGNPNNPNNVDFSTLVFYSKILDVVLHIILVIIGLLVLAVFGLCAYMIINPDFTRMIFDDGSTMPCIYNPLTKTFTQ